MTDWLKAGRAVSAIILSFGFVLALLLPLTSTGDTSPALLTLALIGGLIGAMLGVDAFFPQLFGISAGATMNDSNMDQQVEELQTRLQELESKRTDSNSDEGDSRK